MTTHKATVTREGKIFTFHPEHALPVQRKRGETGNAIDLLQQAFGPLEFLS